MTGVSERGHLHGTAMLHQSPPQRGCPLMTAATLGLFTHLASSSTVWALSKGELLRVSFPTSWYPILYCWGRPLNNLSSLCSSRFEICCLPLRVMSPLPARKSFDFDCIAEETAIQKGLILALNVNLQSIIAGKSGWQVCGAAVRSRKTPAQGIVLSSNPI